MCIDFGGSDAAVSEQLLDMRQGYACLQKVGGKTMPQGMYRGCGGNDRLHFSFCEDILHAAFRKLTVKYVSLRLHTFPKPMKRTRQHCNKDISGRADKKFRSPDSILM